MSCSERYANSPPVAPANPAGESAVTEATAPRRPSSSATAPPSELPAACGRSSPASPRNASTLSASASIPHGAPAAYAADAAEPGQVDRPQLALAGEPVRDRIPRGARHPDPGQQDQRRAVAPAHAVQHAPESAGLQRSRSAGRISSRGSGVDSIRSSGSAAMCGSKPSPVSSAIRRTGTWNVR